MLIMIYQALAISNNTICIHVCIASSVRCVVSYSENGFSGHEGNSGEPEDLVLNEEDS